MPVPRRRREPYSGPWEMAFPRMTLVYKGRDMDCARSGSRWVPTDWYKCESSSSICLQLLVGSWLWLYDRELGGEEGQ